jgi:hypothetical protein
MDQLARWMLAAAEPILCDSDYAGYSSWNKCIEVN